MSTPLISAPRLTPRRVTVTPLHSTVMGRPCRESTGLFMSVLLWTCPRNLRTLCFGVWDRLDGPAGAVNTSSSTALSNAFDCQNLGVTLWVCSTHLLRPPDRCAPGCEERAKVRQPD